MNFVFFAADRRPHLDAARGRSLRVGWTTALNGDRGFDDIISPVLRSAPMREFLPVTI